MGRGFKYKTKRRESVLCCTFCAMVLAEKSRQLEKTEQEPKQTECKTMSAVLTWGGRGIVLLCLFSRAFCIEISKKNKQPRPCQLSCLGGGTSWFLFVLRVFWSSCFVKVCCICCKRMKTKPRNPNKQDEASCPDLGASLLFSPFVCICCMFPFPACLQERSCSSGLVHSSHPSPSAET